jgi:hypothetical protein
MISTGFMRARLRAGMISTDFMRARLRARMISTDFMRARLRARINPDITQDIHLIYFRIFSTFIDPSA